MKGFKKFLLVLYLFITGLFFLAATVFGVAQIAGFVEIPLVKKLDYYFTLPSLVITGIVILFFSIYGLLLIGTLKRNKGVPAVTITTEDGYISITVDAVKTITEFAVKEFEAIQIDTVSVLIKDNNVDIAIRVFFNDINGMAGTTEAMQSRVKEVVEHNAGIVVNRVMVMINDVKGDKPLSRALVPISSEKSLETADVVKTDE